MPIIYAVETDDMEAFKRKRDMEEAWDGHIVDEAMRDLLAGKFETRAVNEVMARRAGSLEEYVKVKDLYDAAARAARHSGNVA